MNEFSRTERLIGTDNMHKLSDSTVAVFGVGGVGSHCIEALARCGTGHLILIDNDVVSETNINRQSIAWHSTVGQHKTRVMKARILDINPAARVDLFETFVLPENLENLLNAMGAVDYMVDAIDTVSAKIALAQYAQIHQIPLIASMGTGNKLHPEAFKIADIYDTNVCPLCRVMRRELKKRDIPALKVLYSEELPRMPQTAGEEKSSGRPAPASISFVPSVAGLLIAGEVIRSLSGIS